MTNDKPVSDDIARMPNEAALPRKNGELVFNAPWQGRAFGMAVSLHNDQRYDWQEFQQRLIQRVSRVDEDDGDKPRDADEASTRYYEQWLGALEQLLLDKALIDSEELQTRIKEYRDGHRHEVF